MVATRGYVEHPAPGFIHGEDASVLRFLPQANRVDQEQDGKDGSH